MRKKLLSFFLLGMMAVGANAQRTTDVIDRGLVAVKTTSGVYCSWRIFGEEYYDVRYNIYRDGQKLNTEPLSVSNFTDKSGTTSSTYTVEAVVRGVPQAQSASVAVWANNYMDIKLAAVTSRAGADITADYEPNDVSVADLDGDGVVEILLKRKNLVDAASTYATDSKDFDHLEAYKLDGTRLWWIDCGPNMVSGSSVEVNIVAYDWDQDGKAEVLLRGADDMVIHKADGTTQTVGTAGVNTRNTISHTANMTYTNTGAEYLLYLNGETGEPYQIMNFPLTRGKADDWGDGYGHRSSKYFFGAPFLDGRKPSIYLGRGIYTKHKMIAYDVDPATHELKQRWYWECSNSSSPWFGQGYHNYGIADVDWDGRDEIVFGSMVIDDNGNGLSTTGLGHGDAQHCSDFDPYTWGQEIFVCNETSPSNNYRDATTSKIYYRLAGGSDDGRAMMGNFTDLYPGAQGTSAHDGQLISSVTAKGLCKSGGIDQNFRLYWDGDLLEETFNYSGFVTSNGYYETGNPRVYKYGVGNVDVFPDSKTCNGTKGTPSHQGDVIGDWREELILRTDDGNLRLFTTTHPTAYRNYTLWHDHQYRQAMVWQMCGYNQPPHTSYFLGQLEGITVAPPPFTMTGRTEVAGGQTIGSAHSDKQVITCETNDMTVAVADGATPYIYIDNAPSWTQGHDDNDNITTQYYTHTLTGGAFAGTMRLVKQGEGVLVLPGVTQTYSGNTDVWNGTLQFDGTMQNSRVWLNRHAKLITDGGRFNKAVEANYNSSIVVGSNKKSSFTADSLILNFGSRMVLDIFSEGNSADLVKARVLKIEKKVWENGPRYSTPILQFVPNNAAGETLPAGGRYLIAEVEKIDGSVADLVIEGVNGMKSSLAYESGKLYLDLVAYQAEDITWTGNVDGKWDLDLTANFVTTAGGEERKFVPGSNVVFDDNAQTTDVVIEGNIAPASITFNNDTKTYTLSGDSIVGGAQIVKNGKGTVTINNMNRVGATTVNEGKLFAAVMANSIGQEYGSLGNTDQPITVNNNATFGVTETVTATQPITVGEGGASIEVKTGKTLTLTNGIKVATSGLTLTKTGNGSLTLSSGNAMDKLVIAAGTVNAVEASNVSQLPETVEFRGGALYDSNSEGSYSTNRANFVVGEGYTGSFYADPRCNYTGTLTGKGTFNVYAAGVRNTFAGDWSAFEGTVVPGLQKRGTYDPSFDFTSAKGLPNATLEVPEGVTFNSSQTVEIGTPKGVGTLGGSGTYVLGTNNSDFTFSNHTSTKVIKRGTGSMMVLSVGKINGAVDVEEGLLKFNDVLMASKVCGANTLTLKSTGGVVGQGYLNSLVMRDNSSVTIRSMFTESPGKIKTDAAFMASGSAVVNFLANSTKCSTLEVGTYLSLVNIAVTLVGGYTPKLGDELVLWKCQNLSSAPSNISLPQLPEGLYWDTTGLSEATGVLRVTDDPNVGIDGVASSATVAFEVFTVGGVKVGRFESTVEEATQKALSLCKQNGTYIIRCKDGRIFKSLKVGK